MTSPAWSFSGIKQFQHCPKQYYHYRVAKDVKEDKTTTDYGTLFHTAAEEYIRDGKALSPAFMYAKEALDWLKALPGEKHCEYKMALTKDFEPVAFFHDQAWLRTVADLLVVNGDKAYILDYKTGKSAKYADTGQLELMALTVFKFFPEVKQIKAGLLFVLANAFVKDKFSRQDEPKLWEKWLVEYKKMQAAYIHDRWNPKQSGLCKKHCAVLECPHNGRN